MLRLLVKFEPKIVFKFKDSLDAFSSVHRYGTDSSGELLSNHMKNCCKDGIG